MKWGVPCWLMLISCVSVVGQETHLPFLGTDTVTVHRVGERAQKLLGRIDDISGESIILRRNGAGATKLLRISDVVKLDFLHGTSFETGLQHRQKREFTEAIRSFDKAIRMETRPWARNELQAVAARTCVMMGDRDGAVERIAVILETDPRSRHVSLLPLVWDARLPAGETVSASPGDLRKESPVRRLVAASALLSTERYRPAAKAALDRIRRETPPRMTALAETQLWRLALLDDNDTAATALPSWQSRLQRLPVEARSGPQYLIARALQRQYDFDQASVGFLWIPFMDATDEALAAMSLKAGIVCLQKSGRVAEARSLTQELVTRFPGTSAAQQKAE